MRLLRFNSTPGGMAVRVRRSRRLLLVAGACVIAGACDDSTGVRVNPPGAFSVTLSGVRTGVYVADGAQPMPATLRSATFSSALESPRVAGAYMISGYRASSDGRQDMLNLFLTSVTGTGAYPASGDLALGMSTATGLPEDVYRIMSGTVRITTLSRTRMAGEFSGVAVGGRFPSTFPDFGSDTVHLSAGTFDVPIIRR